MSKAAAWAAWPTPASDPTKTWCRAWKALPGRGLRNAFVRGALGSLVDACLYTRDGGYRHVSGPAVEIVSLAGEVRAQPDGSLTASLSGVVADPQGQVHGGPFVPGANPICMTFEVTLEEWLPAEDAAA